MLISFLQFESDYPAMAAPFQKNLLELHKIEPLDGTNYKRWSQKLLLCFKQLKIDYVLTTEYADENDTSQIIDAEKSLYSHYPKDACYSTWWGCQEEARKGQQTSSVLLAE